MSINWIKDEPGIAVLADAGIHVHDVVVSVDSINRKASAENRARKNPLDDSRIEGIKNAYVRGIPIPKIVVRKDARNGNVIAGGNHRFASLNGEKSIPVHMIECTDAEFETACKLLNTVVGDGMAKDDRIANAVDAHLRLQVEKKVACKLYGVSESTLNDAIKTREIQARLAAFPSRVRDSVTISHVKQLGELAKNDNVLRAAIQAVSVSKITAKDVADLAKEARSQSTESEQVAVFDRFTKLAEVDSTKAIPRRHRKAFLSACTQIKNAKGKSWESLEFTKEEIAETKEIIKEAIATLGFLLRADG